MLHPRTRSRERERKALKTEPASAQTSGRPLTHTYTGQTPKAGLGNSAVLNPAHNRGNVVCEFRQINHLLNKTPILVRKKTDSHVSTTNHSQCLGYNPKPVDIQISRKISDKCKEKIQSIGTNPKITQR